jgi:hypothetical protein
MHTLLALVLAASVLRARRVPVRWGIIGAGAAEVDPGYDGPVLIRGLRIDAPGRVGFGRGSVPEWAMRIRGDAGDNQAGGWRNFPSYTRLKDNGCYAYQVDDRDFSYSIVFRARRQSL